MSYTITAEDTAGPFLPIPEDMMEKAKLKRLDYTSVVEALGERFHSAPALLKRLNPTASFVAGEQIEVPNVAVDVRAPPHAPADAAAPAKPREPAAQARARQRDRHGFEVHVCADRRRRGRQDDLLRAGHDRQPARSAAARPMDGHGVVKNPTFNYNPDLFWDADPAHAKAKIPAGPNGPVGVVWIDISKSITAFTARRSRKRSAIRSRTAACASPTGMR